MRRFVICSNTARRFAVTFFVVDTANVRAENESKMQRLSTRVCNQTRIYCRCRANDVIGLLPITMVANRPSVSPTKSVLWYLKFFADYSGVNKKKKFPDVVIVLRSQAREVSIIPRNNYRVGGGKKRSGTNGVNQSIGSYLSTSPSYGVSGSKGASVLMETVYRHFCRVTCAWTWLQINNSGFRPGGWFVVQRPQMQCAQVSSDRNRCSIPR